MEQKMKVVVLGANRYSFEDQQTKREVKGCKVHYVALDNPPENNQVGMIPMAENMEYSYFTQLGQVPGVYEATVGLQMRGRSIRPKITNFKFLEPVTFELPVKA